MCGHALLASLLLAAPALALGPVAPALALGPVELERLFPDPPPGWDVVREMPEAADAALRARGMRGSVARHYTRARGRVSEVCTVELWSFELEDHARLAGASLARPDWRILQSEAILILLHGVRTERGVGARRGLVEGCEELGEQTRARVAAAG